MPSGDAFVHHLDPAFTSPIQKGTNGCENRRPSTGCGGHVDDQFLFVKCDEDNRSEERRVGKECRSRWSPYH